MTLWTVRDFQTRTGKTKYILLGSNPGKKGYQVVRSKGGKIREFSTKKAYQKYAKEHEKYPKGWGKR